MASLLQSLVSWVQHEDSTIENGKIVTFTNTIKEYRGYYGGGHLPDWDAIRLREKTPANPEITNMEVSFHYEKAKIPIFEEIFELQKEIFFIEKNVPYHRLFRKEFKRLMDEMNDRNSQKRKEYDADRKKILEIIKNNPSIQTCSNFDEDFSEMLWYEGDERYPDEWYAEVVKTTVILPWTSELAQMIREKRPEKQHKILGGCWESGCCL